MNYLNMLVHQMAGSGYSELIIEANLTTSGCLKGVLNGKAYSKSLWCLKIVSEAVERLLLAAYIAQRDASAHSSANANVVDVLIRLCNEGHLAEALQDDTMNEYLVDYMSFHKRVRNGELGKTGIFWMSFLDHARRVFLLLYAVKTNNFKLYHKCMGDMADLFFAFGGMNYSRYLSPGLMFSSTTSKSAILVPLSYWKRELYLLPAVIYLVIVVLSIRPWKKLS